MKPIKMKQVAPGIVYEQIRTDQSFLGSLSQKSPSKKTDSKSKINPKDPWRHIKQQQIDHPTEFKIANKIYNAKGYVWDNEYAAVKAILSIKDTKQYDIVQKIFSKLSDGRNMINYVASFIQFRDSVNTLDAPITIKYIESLIKHLNKIGVSNQSIKPLLNKLAYVKKWYAVNVSQAQQPGQIEFAWDTWMKRSLQDPEFKHAYFNMLAAVTSFIPGIGLLVSSGIYLADAAAYYQEGDRLNAGYSAIFALVPAALKGISKIPFIQKLGARGMAALAEKLATSKYSLLNKTEIYAIHELVKYKDLIKQDLNAYFKARVRNELSHALTTASSTGAKRLLSKLGTGTLKMSVLGTKFAAQGGTFLAAQHATDKTWDKIYNKMGYEKLDYKDQSEKDARDALKLINQLKNP